MGQDRVYPWGSGEFNTGLYMGIYGFGTLLKGTSAVFIAVHGLSAVGLKLRTLCISAQVPTDGAATIFVHLFFKRKFVFFLQFSFAKCRNVFKTL